MSWKNKTYIALFYLALSLLYSCAENNHPGETIGTTVVAEEAKKLKSEPFTMTPELIQTNELLKECNNFNDSISVFEEMIEKNNQSADMHIAYIDFLYKAQKRKELLKYYSSLLEQSPENPLYLYFNARIEYNREKAMEYIKKALSVDENFYWGHLYKGEYLNSFFDRDTALVIAAFSDAIKINPAYPKPFFCLSQLYYELFDDKNTAVYFAEQAYKCDPSYKENSIWLADLYKELKMYRELIRMRSGQIRTETLSNNKSFILYEISSAYAMLDSLDSCKYYLDLAYRTDTDFVFKKLNHIDFGTISKDPEINQLFQMKDVYAKNILQKEIMNLKCKTPEKKNSEELINLYEELNDYNKCLSLTLELSEEYPDSLRYIYNQAKYLKLCGKSESVLPVIKKLLRKGFSNYSLIKRSFPEFAENDEFNMLLGEIKKKGEEFSYSREIKYYNRDKGLSHQNVWSVFIDKDSYLWVGTEIGLNRFDGKEFQVFNPSNNFPYHYAASIAETGNNLVILTWYHGLITFDSKNFKQYGLQNGLVQIGSPSSEMVKDNKGNLWFGMGLWQLPDGGLGYYNGEEIISLTFADGLPGKIVSNVYWFKDQLWLGTENGLSIFDGEKFIRTYTTKDGLPSNFIRDITADRFGNLWIATGYGLSKFDGNKFTNYFKEDGLSSDYIGEMLFDKHDNLWLLTMDGAEYGEVNVMRNGRFYYYDVGIYGGSPMCILEDKFENIWIGFYKSGLIKISPKDFIKKPVVNGLEIKDIFINGVGEEFIVATNDSFYTYEGKPVFRQNCSIDSKGNIWYTRDNRIIKTDLKTEKSFGTEDGIPEGQIIGRGFLEDKNNNLWFGVRNSCMIKYDGKKFHKYTTADGLADNSYMDLVSDSKKNLWFCYERKNAMTKWDGEKFTNISFSEFKGDNIGWIMKVDCRDNIWVSTWSDGLIRYDGKKLTSYNQYSFGLSFEPDLDGNVWNNAPGKLVKLNPETKEIIEYNYSDGYSIDENRATVIAQTSDGNLWFQSDGFMVLNIYNMDRFPPVNNISKIYANDSLLDKNNEYKLSHSLNNLRFYFTGTNFRSENRIAYKTMLEGFDNDWNKITAHNEINYTNLPSGEYIFKVISRNQHGFWNEKPAEFRFKILNPWYFTWWFISMAIIALISGIYLIFRLRLKSLQREKEKLEQIVKERTAEIHQQKEEIEAQRDQLEVSNTILSQQKEEIEAQRDEIEAQRDLVVQQKDQITEIFKEVKDSIHYAKRIQRAVLPAENDANQILGEHFILFKPRDVVSGDFYWFAERESRIFIAVADCTGHGVPGGFMSMLGISFLNEILSRGDISTPALILNEMRRYVISSLQQQGIIGEQKDGMDMSVIVLDKNLMSLQFSGANNGIYIYRKSNNLLDHFRPDKMPVAIHDNMETFSNHMIEVNYGDIVYMYSDGYADQFGGPKGRKFMYKQFKEILLEQSNKPLLEQKEVLEFTFENWKGDFDQIDDVLVMGIKI